jgi:hypothetical protein
MAMIAAVKGSDQREDSKHKASKNEPMKNVLSPISEARMIPVDFANP